MVLGLPRAETNPDLCCVPDLLFFFPVQLVGIYLFFCLTLNSKEFVVCACLSCFALPQCLYSIWRLVAGRNANTGFKVCFP